MSLVLGVNGCVDPVALFISLIPRDVDLQLISVADSDDAIDFSNVAPVRPRDNWRRKCNTVIVYYPATRIESNQIEP